MKEELLQFDGVVTEILPDARYRVQLDVGHAEGTASRRWPEIE
jgi:translation initiation factor IF-1